MRGNRLLLMAAVLALSMLGPISTAQAGCGCDHPPPDWKLVMPPFASPGNPVTIFADGGSFVPGATYVVTFHGNAGNDVAVKAVADATDSVTVALPAGLDLGGTAISVAGSGYSKSYHAGAFTALPEPRLVPPGTDSFTVRDYAAAVGDDGTLYLPMDVSQVRDATQFAFAFRDLPLEFDANDVVIYNRDGVDLTIFELDVDDDEYQWGLYFGWEVEVDDGLFGTVYDGQVAAPVDEDNVSHVFTYWRHEFHTYADAHAPGGSHWVNGGGYHPDGTKHVDHDHLVIAIKGMVRSDLLAIQPVVAPQPLPWTFASTGNVSLGSSMMLGAPTVYDGPTLLPLQSGAYTAELAWVSAESPVPVDAEAMAAFAEFGGSAHELPVSDAPPAAPPAAPPSNSHDHDDDDDGGDDDDDGGDDDDDDDDDDGGDDDDD